MDPNQTVNILTGKTPHQTIAEERYKEEMVRRSEDEIRIYNPLDEEYICYWNSYGNSLPSKRHSVFKRYIAEKAMYEIINMILTQKAKEYIDRLNQARYDNNQPKLTPQESSRIEESPDWKITEAKNRMPYVRIIWKGIYKENKMDIVLPSKKLAPQDTRPVDEQLIEQIDMQTLVEGESPQKPMVNKDYIEGVGIVQSDNLSSVPPIEEIKAEDIVPRKK